METPEVKKAIVVKDGVAKVEFAAKYDGDKDGVASAEAGAFIKLSVNELLKEVIVAQDKPTLLAALPFIKQLSGMIPDLEKEI